jgi:hypothetical protein
VTANAAVPPANLYQRIAAIAGAVSVRATGRTAQGQRTISIADAEDALGDLMAEHGVVSGFRWNARPEVVGQEGKVSTWLADITVWLVNADAPDDRLEQPLYDVGSSPSAAVSFALKRFYRALFHLASEEDENRSVAGAARAQAQPRATAQQQPAVTTKPAVTTEQRAELKALDDALPEDLRLSAEGKKALVAEGFEAAKEALLARAQEAATRNAEQPSLPVGGPS